MSIRLFERAVIATLLGLVGLSLGCDKSPTSPLALHQPPASSGPVTVTGIFPARGLMGDTVTVEGTGFVFGATLTMDGLAARVTVVTSTAINAITPAHAVGTVDVVVTNPGGESGTLAGGYTFDVVTLTASRSAVRSGGQLTLSWMAPGRRSHLDWVGLFKVGDPSTSYEDGWWQYTNGLASGTVTLSAPTNGEYEFRYLLDDGYVDVARSPRVTVSASGPL